MAHKFKKHPCRWCRVNMVGYGDYCYTCISKKHHGLIMEVKRQQQEVTV